MLGPAEEPAEIPYRHHLYLTVSNAIADQLQSLGVEPSRIHEAAEAVVERLTANRAQSTGVI